jgi:DNA-binding NarL/FixJ family response regulator
MNVVMSVRVFIANDHAILRGALRAVINMQADMEVVGEAATEPDAETGIQKTEPDVVLIDLGMANGGGLDAIAAVKRIRSRTGTVVLTFQEELGYIRSAIAVGYVVKRVMNTELLSTIRAVAQERTFAGASLSGASLSGASLSGASLNLKSAQHSTEPSPSDSASTQGTAGLTGPELQMGRSCARRARPLRALIDPG